MAIEDGPSANGFRQGPSTHPPPQHQHLLHHVSSSTTSHTQLGPAPSCPSEALSSPPTATSPCPQPSNTSLRQRLKKWRVTYGVAGLAHRIGHTVEKAIPDGPGIPSDVGSGDYMIHKPPGIAAAWSAGSGVDEQPIEHELEAAAEQQRREMEEDELAADADADDNALATKAARKRLREQGRDWNWGHQCIAYGPRLHGRSRERATGEAAGPPLAPPAEALDQAEQDALTYLASRVRLEDLQFGPMGGPPVGMFFGDEDEDEDEYGEDGYGEEEDEYAEGKEYGDTEDEDMPDLEEVEEEDMPGREGEDAPDSEEGEDVPDMETT